MAAYLGGTPGWCDPATGLPRTWLHYAYGLLWVNRERARRSLAMASAGMVHRMEKQYKDRWWALQAGAAGED